MRAIFGSSALIMTALAGIGCSDRARPGEAEHALPPPSIPHGPPLQDLGEQAYADGQIDSARTLFLAARKQSLADGDSAALARSLTWLAQANWRLGDYQATRELGEAGLALKLRLGLEEELFRSYNVLGLLAWNESRLLDASELFFSATRVAVTTGDSVNLAKVSNNLALVRTSLGEFQEAENGFRTARAMAHAVGDPLIEGRVLINLGMLAIEVGDPRLAAQWIQEARPLLKSADDPVGEQSALGHLGVAYAAMGESGKAIACLDSALIQARAQGLRQEEASNLEQLAQLLLEAGNLTRALQLFDEARSINAELGLIDELASDLANQAQIRATLGNLDLALQDAEEALRAHREIGSPLREVEDLVLLAELSREAGRMEEAREHLASAERLAMDLAVRTARITVALGKARLAAGDENPREVLQILKEAEPDISVGGYGVEWESHALRARAYAALGDLASAATEGQRAVDAVERVREAYASGVMRDSYLRERAATYSGLVAVLLEMGRTEEAFEVSDAARGRALVERVATLGASVRDADGGAVRGLSESDHILRRIDELTRTLEELEEWSLEEEGEEYEIQAQTLAEELGGLRSEYAVSLMRAEEHDPEGAALLGGKRSELGEIRDALQQGEAILEYLVSDDAVGLFVVTREQVRHFETEVTREALASRVRIARGVVQKPNPGGDLGSGALEGLHEILLGAAIGADALSEVQRLIILPHGELSYLPFAALRSKSTGRFLVEDYLMSELPAAGALPVLRGRAARLGGGWQTPVSVFAPFPRILPGTSLEIEAIRGVQGEGVFLEGRDASEGRFREELRRARVIHAATHGVMNARNPLFSRIELVPDVMAPGTSEERGRFDSDRDGRLEVHELLHTRADAVLVFLSGCETAMGPGWSTGFGRGEEFATLGQAFLHAGAENVIATLWRIDDPGAAAFAERFYQELDRRRDPVEALAFTQRAMIQDSRYGSPFFWGAYRLTGTGDIRERDGLGSSPGAGPGPDVR
jgi:CHAT domain-containing protein/Tfp pilus assembly protein PilF